MHLPVDPSVSALLGPARDPHQPLHGVEAQGAPVVEAAWIWHDTVLDLRHITPGPAARSSAAGWLPALRSEQGEVFVETERGEARLDPGQALAIERGGAQVLLRLAPAGRRVAGRFDRRIDLPFVGIMSFATFLAGALSVVIASSPPPVEQQVVELPDRFVELILAAPPPPQEVAVAAPTTRPDAGEGKRRAGEEGQTGRERGKRQARGGPDLEQRRLDREIAEDAGVLGALAEAGALGGVFDAGVSGDLAAGIGSLHGAVGVQLGTGYGQRGRGLGGGGNEVGSFHGTGTRGLSSGSSGAFAGGGDIGPKRDGGVRAGGDPIIVGALDPALIDGLIKRHLASFRFCYQRQLQSEPELSGKVTLQFVIAKDGSVSRAKVKSSSMGSPAVESCLSDRMLRLRFPEPKGGGIVMVTYPFVFSRQ
ncbi:TonB family protein [Myxococcota bacterium]|nr:TonB family protein [Myxococcota bacterium]